VVVVVVEGVDFLLKLAGGEDFSNSPPATSVLSYESVGGGGRHLNQ
jgi:hypothetical protein